MAGRLAASILVRLIDEVSKPAAKAAKSIREIESAAKRLKGMGGKLDFKVAAGGAKPLDGMARTSAKLTRELQNAGKAAASIKVAPGGAAHIDAMTRSAGKLTGQLRNAAKAAAGIKINLGANPFGGMRNDIAGLIRDMNRAAAASRKIGTGAAAGGRAARSAGRGAGGMGPPMPPGYGYGPGYGGRRRGRGRYYDGDNEGASYLANRATAGAMRGTGRVAGLAGKAGADAVREEARDFLAGLSDSDSGKIKAKASELSAKYPSVDAATLHNMLRDTSMSMGGTDKSFAVADSIGQSATVLQSLKGKDKAIDNVRQFFSALDVLGKNVDPKQVTSLADAYVKAMGVEGAEMDMGKVLTFAKNAKSGGAALNDKFLMSTVPALMQDLGHYQTGTALSSMVGQVIGGRATKKSKAYQMGLGMRGENGEMPDADKKMITENPFEYTTKRLIPMLEKRGVNPDDDTKVVEVMSKAFSNSRVADLFTKMITQRSQYQRKDEQYDRAPGLKAADELKTRDPYVALGGAVSQLTNVLSQIAQPFVPAATAALNTVAGGAGATAQTLAEKPEIAKTVAPVAAGLGASLAAWLTGKGLLAAAANSNGLAAGVARILGTGLTGVGVGGGVVAPIAGVAAAGAVMDTSDARSAGTVRGAITGEDTPMQRTVKALSTAIADEARAATASDILRGRTNDFQTGRVEPMGDATAPTTSRYEESRGLIGDFLLGLKKSTQDLPGFGFIGRETPEGGGPRRPEGLGGAAPASVPVPAPTVAPAAPAAPAPPAAPAAPSAPAAPAAPPAPVSLPSVDAGKIEEATAALAKYRAELATITSELSASKDLELPGVGSGLEEQQTKLRAAIAETEAKLKALSAEPVAPQADASSLQTLDAAADATKGKLAELSGVSVAPTVDSSSIAAANAQVTQLIANLARVGAAAQGAVSAVGRATAASQTAAAARTLDRSRQTTMTG